MWDPLLLNQIGMSGVNGHGVIGGVVGGREGMIKGAGALSNTIHKYLKEAGVDGVKVDAQAACTMMGEVSISIRAPLIHERYLCCCFAL